VTRLFFGKDERIDLRDENGMLAKVVEGHPRQGSLVETGEAKTSPPGSSLSSALQQCRITRYATTVHKARRHVEAGQGWPPISLDGT